MACGDIAAWICKERHCKPRHDYADCPFLVRAEAPQLIARSSCIEPLGRKAQCSWASVLNHGGSWVRDRHAVVHAVAAGIIVSYTWVALGGPPKIVVPALCCEYTMSSMKKMIQEPPGYGPRFRQCCVCPLLRPVSTGVPVPPA